jgi:RNA polymerase sigma-70 factor (ECF subfamily)
MTDARRAAEDAARASYGRLVAFLAVHTRDIAAAEDALADAFAAALDHWPRTGVPAAPEAWLLTAARRRLIDGGRRAAVRNIAAPHLLQAIEEAHSMAREERFIDERLKLLFICAHPAIDAAARTPLMLQTVLGLDAARIASAFLVSPATMSQRLVRAKRKIAEARIPFEVPRREDLNARAASVLDAIYAAFGAGYDGDNGAESNGDDLSREALFLARLVATLLPEDAEAHGLVALMHYVDARREARRPGGAYVPLDAQDVSLWRQDEIDAGDEALAAAARLKAPGRYQLEAAIQSAHLSGRIGGCDTRQAVLRLYERLLSIAPSIGAAVGRAAALIKADRSEAALSLLDAIDADRIADHQPFWATRAHALAALGRRNEAHAAFERAIGLSADGATRDFLAARRAALVPD